MLIGSIAGVSAPSIAHAQRMCPADEATALEHAQEMLRSGDHTEIETVVACLVQALAETRAELEGLKDGRIAFSGQIYAPKGFVMTKPSVQEGR